MQKKLMRRKEIYPLFFFSLSLPRLCRKDSRRDRSRSRDRKDKEKDKDRMKEKEKKDKKKDKKEKDEKKKDSKVKIFYVRTCWSYFLSYTVMQKINK